jgi:HrpA-like RNA helicase
MARRQNGGGASKAGGRGRGSGVHSGHHRRQVNTEIAHATDAGPMYIALSRREREAIQELNDGRVSTQLTSTLHALPQAREKGSVPTACVTTGLGAGTTSTTVPKQLGGGAGATDPGCASVGQDGRPPTSDSPSSDVGLTLRAEFEKQQKSSGWVAMQPARAALPVTSTRGELLGEIARCDVTIVSGGTGCGKSTQVPQ